jgi:hypothetical protein
LSTRGQTPTSPTRSLRGVDVVLGDGRAAGGAAARSSGFQQPKQSSGLLPAITERPRDRPFVVYTPPPWSGTRAGGQPVRVDDAVGQRQRARRHARRLFEIPPPEALATPPNGIGPGGLVADTEFATTVIRSSVRSAPLALHDVVNAAAPARTDARRGSPPQAASCFNSLQP